MKKRTQFLLFVGLLLFVLLGLIGMQLLTTDLQQLASHLGHSVAVVTDLDDVLVNTNYDETFLDPHSDAIQLTGAHWLGSTEIHQRADPYVHLLALTATGSQLEVACTEPTDSVGIQFWGDDNDGWAEVVIDEDFVWQRDTGGLKEYVEFTSLAESAHTIRISALGRPEDGPNVHVTVAGISCLQRGPVMARIQRIFLPLISN